jgi:hypothetical protein
MVLSQPHILGGLVQCGWCPEIMANDEVVVCLHFAEVHRYSSGYSVRYIRGDDWDIAEIAPETGGARC